MKERYGIELTSTVDKTFILQLLSEKQNFLDYTDTIIILPSKKEAEQLKPLLIQKNLYENCYPLIELKKAKLTNLSNDYGFYSCNNTFYLFSDLVIGISFVEGNKTNQQMAFLQLEEYIVAESNGFYLVDSQFDELVQKIATAYEVKIAYFTSTK